VIGRTIGHYRILGHLGDGGMGVVYRAEDTRLGRVVALKLLPPELTRDPEAKRRFEREARAAALLDHPNICTTYDFGEAEGDGQMYIAMACYEGESLADRVTHGPLSLDDAIKILEQICRGLGKAHASGVIHRDIKPGNVMLTADGVVKIVDFGLAKLSAGSQLTKSRTSLGTAAYMAPEQLRGEEVGPQTDIWASGIVLFELLTGTRPFRGDYAEALSYSILNEQPATITELRPDLPVEIDRIIKKMLRKDPLQRYASTDEVIAELEVLRTPSSGSGKSGPRSTKVREPLRAGAKLGPYEIVEPLGSGGMGDVYRARDTRLDRQVALKVLAPEFSEDAERKQRFQREAKTISSLSHPNICTLFDVGEQEGTDYLVMEYLEGETLAERLTRGALPLTELLKTGIQIGEALGRAHQQGIVHRDLKPGNVMLTKTGAVKLLDFGLAKDVGAVTTTPRRRSGSPSPDKPLTAEGAIVGTLAYMAPEQVEGQEADARSDIFAYGAILYEMATGKRAFEGATKANLIAAILTAQPALLAEIRRGTTSTSGTSRSLATIEHAVRQCLEKDPDRRWQSAIDVANELRWMAEKGAEAEAGAGSETRVARPWKISILVLSLVAVTAIGAAVWLARARFSQTKVQATPVPRLVRLTWNLRSYSPSISPDGASFAYSSDPSHAVGEDTDIFVCRIGGENPINLTKSFKGGDGSPKFSPDGQSIAFRSERDGGGIFIMGASGESVRRLTSFGVDPAWSPDGKSIAFGSRPYQGGASDAVSPLWVVDVATGETRKIFNGDAVNPCWSPSGTRLAFNGMRQSMLGGRVLCTIAVSGGSPTEVVSSPGGGWLFSVWTPGWIWYSNADRGPPGLWRIQMDDATGKPIGAPEPVMRSTSEIVRLSVSADVSKVLFQAVSDQPSLLRWDFDAARGLVSPAPRPIITGGRQIYVDPGSGPSPDGEWIATILIDTSNEFKLDIVLVRAATGETRRLTNDSARKEAMAWAPDGSRLYFCVAAEGKSELWSIRPDGSGRERVLGATPVGEILNDLASPDGRSLYVEAGKTHQPYFVDVSVPFAQRRPIPLPLLPDKRSFAARRWSPDGRWILGAARKADGTTDDALLLFDVEKKTYRTIGDVKDSDCFWLPDSRRILLLSGVSGELKILDRESGLMKQAGSVGREAGNVVLSRDGRWLVGNGGEGQCDIWMLDYGAKP
jgi:eukaryotic-like serine/threonine-protein kinase